MIVRAEPFRLDREEADGAVIFTLLIEKRCKVLPSREEAVNEIVDLKSAVMKLEEGITDD